MASWLVRLFMYLKVEVAVDEACRKQRRTLNMAHTNLKRMSPSTIVRLYSSIVRRLLLQENFLRELPENFGFMLKKLDLLTLDYNELTELPASFGFLENLVFLNISNNLFEEFPSPIFSLKNLKTLWANGIAVREIPEEINMLTKLRFLGLRNNMLTKISTGICTLKKLRWLTLENNQIEFIPIQISNLNNLIHLNLNFNQIIGLPDDIWNHLTELSFLFLESNFLEVNDFMVEQIQQLPKLKKAYLHGNPRYTNNDLKSYNEIVTPKPIQLEDIPTTSAEAYSNNTVAASEENDGTINSILSSLRNTESNQSISVTTIESISSNTFDLEFEDMNIVELSDALRNYTHPLQTDMFEQSQSISASVLISLQQMQVDEAAITHNEQIPALQDDERNQGQDHQVENLISNSSNEGAAAGPRNPEIEIQEFDNEAELHNYLDSWEISESTSRLDGNISASEESDFEELPFDTDHATFGLWGFLTT